MGKNELICNVRCDPIRANADSPRTENVLFLMSQNGCHLQPLAAPARAMHLISQERESSLGGSACGLGERPIAAISPSKDARAANLSLSIAVGKFFREHWIAGARKMREEMERGIARPWQVALSARRRRHRRAAQQRPRSCRSSGRGFQLASSIVRCGRRPRSIFLRFAASRPGRPVGAARSRARAGRPADSHRKIRPWFAICRWTRFFRQRSIKRGRARHA